MAILNMKIILSYLTPVTWIYISATTDMILRMPSIIDTAFEFVPVVFTHF